MKKLLIILGLLSLVSCGKKEAEVKSIEDIQKEKGVPVRVITVTSGSLEKWDNYSTTLRGISEVNVVPTLGDRLEKIYVKIGDYVKKDQKLAVYAKDNIQARNSAAKAGYELAKATFERVSEVYKTGSISQQDYDGAKTQFEVAKEGYLSSNKVITIDAPISGKIVDMYLNDDKKILDPNKDAIFRIADISKVKAKVFVQEAIIRSIKKGDIVKVTWEGAPDKDFEGKVSVVSLSATEKVRGFAVEIIIDNKEKILTSGIYVDIAFKTVDKKDVVSVPKPCISIDEEGNSYVYLSKNDKSEKRVVKLGEDTGTEVEIVEGVSVGDVVVTEGMKFLKTGFNVKVIK